MKAMNNPSAMIIKYKQPAAGFGAFITRPPLNYATPALTMHFV